MTDISEIPLIRDADLFRYRRGVGQISADFERGRFAKVSVNRIGLQ
jgi:hypothetical protein